MATGSVQNRCYCFLCLGRSEFLQFQLWIAIQTASTAAWRLKMGEDGWEGRRWADALAQVRFHPECRARDTKIAHQHFESSWERVERLWLVDVIDTTNLLQHQQGETLQHESKWKSWLGTDHRQPIYVTINKGATDGSGNNNQSKLQQDVLCP